MVPASRLLAISAVLTAAACASSVAVPHHGVRARPPVGALLDSWGSIGIHGGHAELWYRGRRWTSAGAFHRPPEWISSVAVTRSRLAFSVEGRGLFVAKLPGKERRILGARDETPLTWTGAGDLLDYGRGGYVVARAAGGALLRRWPVRAGAVDVDASGSLLYLTPSGALVRTDGEHTARVADADDLAGPARHVEVLADRSVAILGARQLAVVSPAGRLIASASAPGRRFITQEVSAAPDGRGYAYVVTDQRVKGGIDHVELLLPGGRVPRTLATVPVSRKGCGWGSEVRWDGSRVRYRNADGGRLALDTGA
jgi:hypothetical protein